MRVCIFYFLFFSSIINSVAQEKTTYQKPAKSILELADVDLAPRVRINEGAKTMVFLYRNSFKTIAHLSEKEMRLAGLRINPKTNISSRITFYNNIKTKKTEEKLEKQVEGLPENAQIAHFTWSPDQSKAAFTNTTSTGVELWILDVKTSKASKLTEANLSANMGKPFQWFKNNETLLVKLLLKDRKSLVDVDQAVPEGPTVSVSDGSKAQNRTYQDLLKNPNDEYNFENLAISELYQINLNGTKNLWKSASMFQNVTFSPDGEYVMTTEIRKPFSYLVPYRRFPHTVTIFTKNGDLVKIINEVALNEVLPKGFMSVREGKRSISWLSNKPATLIWATALDKGDPAIEVSHRDEVFLSDAPFDTSVSLIKTINRYYRSQGTDNGAIIIYDYWWNTRNTKTYLVDPTKTGVEPIVLHDRNYQDIYNDPGSFITKKNTFNSDVVIVENNNLFLSGDGFTNKGQFPFVDKLNIATQKTSRMYQSEYTNKLEKVVDLVDIKKGIFLVQIQSPTEYPNYYFRNINKNNNLKQITNFKNPFTSIQNVHKEVIKYKREDGLELSGTLYLPVGYDKTSKNKMPMILWAYPEEFKDKSSASQSTNNPNRFTYPHYGSMIYWVTRGYVVLDGASFPIVGEGDTEPNDSFRKQLVANGKAAIDAVDAMGYIDRNRVAVGGHSYGAFMTANLLSHSDLFAAGIARSGAYNRTLTPFGFQSEERNYWEAPEVYYTISPFMHADKMKTPLLLIHGEADNNSGTYPLQSERYFNALKGLGATARLVMLPKESHGYRAKESILHMLWEQDQWLEKYVKNKKESTNSEAN